MITDDPKSQFEELKTQLFQQIQGLFPIRDKANRIEVRVKDLSTDDHLGTDDIKGQAEARLSGRSWAVPVTGRVEVVDTETGKALISKQVQLAKIPKLTRHYTYIIGGQEKTIMNQWRLRPGPYVKETAKPGEFEAQFQLAKGRSFNLQTDLAAGHLFMSLGSRKIPLYSLLHAYGVTDEDMKKTWGADTFAATKSKAKPARDLKSFYEAWTGSPPPEGAKLEEEVRRLLNETKMDPVIAHANLGLKTEKVDGSVLFSASRKLLDVSAGRRAPDPIDSLRYKELWSAKDHFVERLGRSAPEITSRVQRALARPTLRAKLLHGDTTVLRDVVMPDLIQRPLYHVFSTSLAGTGKQTNPIALLSDRSAVTITGPGGIENPHAITPTNTRLDPSHLGFLDPVFTPESNAGVVTHLTTGARIKDRKPYVRLYNLKTGKLEDVDAATAATTNIVLPDQVVWEKGKPKPVHANVRMSDAHGEIRDDVPWSKAHYVLPSAAQVFAVETNLVPFMQNDSAGRTTMSARHMAQAISITGREPPKVQVEAGAGQPFEKIVGSTFLAHKTPVDGVVREVKADEIAVQGKDGKIHRVHIYNHYPTNDPKGQLHSKPVVKPGQQVRAGQLLADNNYTNNGTLALGTNLRVAYLANGLNHEDGIVISESAAHKLSSEHLNKPSMLVTDTHVIGKKEFLLAKPALFEGSALQHIDDGGVARVGAVVKPGQPLVLALADTSKAMSIGESARIRLGRKLKSRFNNASLIWDHPYEGEVVRVTRSGKMLEVHLKTHEPIQVGSKLSTRHSAKGIVTQILPDHEMPHDEKGKPVEMLLNPVGVAGRMNPGQVLETVAGKLADKTGKPYLVKNFEGGVDYLKKVKGELRKHGISETEALYDPKTKRKVGDVTVGPHYVFQLEHQIDKKTHVRSGGHTFAQTEAPKILYDNDTKIPRGGGHSGGQSLGALGIYAAIASGLKNNLREMQSLKSDQSQAMEVWGALTNGDRLPAPQVPFVFKKFEAMLTGLGLNVHKEGAEIRLLPRSDSETKKLSRGEITQPSKTIRGKDDEPIRGGLFDRTITGGPGGQHWGHIELVEPMPHPLYTRVISQTLGVNEKDIPLIVQGQKQLPDGSFGGKAFRDALAKIDLNKELEETKVRLNNPKVKGAELDRLNHKYKALTTLKETGTHPKDAWTIRSLPVIPPVYRPQATLPDGTIKNNPLNQLYKRLGIVNDTLKRGEKKIPYNVTLDARAGLYHELQNLFGTTPKGKKALDLDVRGSREDPSRQLPGIIHMISGDQPKDGFFQDKIVEKKQDYTARATIVVDPNLSVDEIGVPKKVALELFRPLVARRLIQVYRDPVKSNLLISREDPVAVRALEEELKHRPVLMKRDPVLHQYGLVGQRVRLTDSPAIKVSPLILPPLGGDIDGDCCWGYAYLRVVSKAEDALTQKWTVARLQELGIHAPDMEGLALAFAASTKVRTTSNEGTWVSVDLANFPRLGPGRVDSRGNTEYPVPDFVEVLALGSAPGDTVKPYRVSHFSVHPDLDMVRVLFASGRSAEVSTDHSLYCMDPETLVPRKTVPAEAMGRLSPRPRRLAPAKEQVVHDVLTGASGRCSDIAILTPILGYALGVLVGGGWADSQGHVCCGKGQYAALVADTYAGLKELVPDLHLGFTETGYGQERDSGSRKQVYSSTDLTTCIAGWIGKGAENKHLPPFFQVAPERFRWELLSGLLDSDGGLSHDKNGRFAVNYTTASRELAEEIQLLATSLGLRTSANNYERARGDSTGTYYYVTFWTQDLVEPARNGQLRCRVEEKQVVLDALGAKEFVPSGTLAKQDIVPISVPLFTALKKIGPKKLGSALYSQLHETLADHPTYTTRQTAMRIAAILKREILEHPQGKAWLAILENQDIVWDRVTGIEPIPGTHEAYDLTVPGPYTFMLTSQLVVWDTVALFVPLAPEAVEEAKRIMPSQRPLSDSSGDVLFTPANESALSLYRATLLRNGKVTHQFANAQEAEKAFGSNKIKLDDLVTIGGTKTTLGRHRISQIVPEKYQHDVLTNIEKPFDRKYQASILKEVAISDPKRFVELADNMSRLGFKMAYESGHTVALKDIEPLRNVRDKLITEARKETDRLERAGKHEEATKHWIDTTRKIQDAYMKHYKDHPTDVSDMAVSGIKAKREQFQGLVMAPMLVEDHLGRPSRVPITRSFAEGVDVGGYFLQAAGARRGQIQKTQSVSEPGYLSKLMVQANIDHPITSKDCGTHNGISMSIHDKDVIDRHLAGSVTIAGKAFPADTPVTPNLIALAQKERVENLIVRSPLKCRMPHGVCSRCMGLHPTGHEYQLGENVGVISSQALGERAAQIMLKQTHGGGIVSTGARAVDQFSLVDRLLNASKRGAEDAALAPKGGKIARVEASRGGTWNIWLEGKTAPLRTRQKPLAYVRPGVEVKKGDHLTEGDPNVHDVLHSHGIDAAQAYMAKRIGDIYAKEGVLRRHAELTVRNVAGTVHVTDPGDHPHIMRGDYVLKPVVDELNQTILKGKKHIQGEPILKNLARLPHVRTQDWMARLQGERLAETLTSAAQTGQRSNLRGLHPIPGLAHGALFGTTPAGQA